MTVGSQIRTSRVEDPSESDVGYLKLQWTHLSLQKANCASSSNDTEL